MKAKKVREIIKEELSHIETREYLEQLRGRVKGLRVKKALLDIKALAYLFAALDLADLPSLIREANLTISRISAGNGTKEARQD